MKLARPANPSILPSFPEDMPMQPHCKAQLMYTCKLKNKKLANTQEKEKLKQSHSIMVISKRIL
jgi:hypothetical protein